MTTPKLPAAFIDLAIKAAELLVSKPFRSRAWNYAFYEAIALTVTGLLFWSTKHRGDPIGWAAVLLNPLMGFMMAGMLATLFHYRPKKREWKTLEGQELNHVVEQATILRAQRDETRHRWLTATFLVHGAVFSLYGWLIKNGAPLQEQPWNQLIAVGNSALAGVALTAAASIAEATWRYQVAVPYITNGNKGPLGMLFKETSLPLGFGIVHFTVTIGLMGLGLWWTGIAITNWTNT